MAETKLNGPLAADDVQKIPYVDDNKYYLVDLQFGSAASWRDFEGQPRKRNPIGEGKIELIHNPKIYRQLGAFQGKIVNGLIATHNDWQEAYWKRKKRDYRGHVDRQILVLNVTETAPPISPHGKFDSVALEAHVQAIVDQKMESLLGSK